MTLLDKAQVMWFERFLASPRKNGVWVLPYDVFTWALPKNKYDAYPNLATQTFPA